MTALKRTVRTRRGVEPAGRPARREVERGRRARTNSSRTFAQRAGRPRSRAARPGGAIPSPAGVERVRRAREKNSRRPGGEEHRFESRTPVHASAEGIEA